ncbi:MAG: hypothetical protein HY706_13490 [Candidatus Hydrogenedentes bacterium]|nr:hypothetical protein [Candidatus Hydrogenedentota bacterium]
MAVRHPRYSKEDFARIGKAIYEDHVRSAVEQGNEGKVVAIDIETGAFALGEDALSASNKLLVRRPDAQIWFVRVGSAGLHRFGPRYIIRVV